MAILSLSNVTIAIGVAYLAFVAHKLYQMLHPLEDVEMGGPSIVPLWQENTTFDMVCVLTTKPKMGYMDITKLKEEGYVLYEERNISYNAAQNLSSISLTIYPIMRDEGSNGTHRVVAPSTVWREVEANRTTVFLHVVLMRGGLAAVNGVVDKKVLSRGDALYGAVRMIKHDRIPRHFRMRYLLADFGLAEVSPLDARRNAMSPDQIISYWKPEVAVRMVNDFTRYPIGHVPRVVYRNTLFEGAGRELSTEVVGYYKPTIFVDEIGLTTDKYVPLNETVAALPLTLSFGPLSVQRWLMMGQLKESLQAQKELGFTERDLDDVRRLITETSLQLLGLTMLASMLHLLFEFLAFQSDISFWRDNRSLAGLSTRTLVTDLISQVIVFLFLLDREASLLVSVPAGFGLLVQAWKVRKATGLTVSLGRYGMPVIECKRWALQEADAQAALNAPTEDLPDSQGPGSSDGTDAKLDYHEVTAPTAANPSSSDGSTFAMEPKEESDQPAEVDAVAVKVTNKDKEKERTERELTRVTLEADRFATTYLSAALFPLVLAYSLRSLIYDKHLSWYSWAIGAATSCVYTFGFVLMCPQLYINHKLKSVSHLPWNFLVYKFINTFIDDLFAFIIKMPTMHRLSVFRDDLVFFIYLYQRWIYRVDQNRPIEK